MQAEQDNILEFEAPSHQTVTYICGGFKILLTIDCKGCGKDVDLKTKETIIRCMQCGYRILYKKRTRQVLQYEAR